MNTMAEDYSDCDLDDFEYLQDQAEGGFETIDGGFAEDVFSGALNNAPRIDMYRHWVYDDMYPDEPDARLENWSDDDLEHYT